MTGIRKPVSGNQIKRGALPEPEGPMSTVHRRAARDRSEAVTCRQGCSQRCDKYAFVLCCIAWRLRVPCNRPTTYITTSANRDKGQSAPVHRIPFRLALRHRPPKRPFGCTRNVSGDHQGDTKIPARETQALAAAAILSTAKRDSHSPQRSPRTCTRDAAARK